jgi:hypothetical protein
MILRQGLRMRSASQSLVRILIFPLKNGKMGGVTHDSEQGQLGLPVRPCEVKATGEWSPRARVVVAWNHVSWQDPPLAIWRGSSVCSVAFKHQGDFASSTHGVTQTRSCRHARSPICTCTYTHGEVRCALTLASSRKRGSRALTTHA